MKPHSIRQYVAWITLGPLIAIVACLEFFYLHSYFSELDLHLVERGKLIANQLSSSSEYGVVSNNIPFLQSLAHGVSLQTDVHGVDILNATSHPLVEAGNFSEWARSILANSGAIAADNSPATIRYGAENLLIYHPIIPETVTLDEFETTPALKPVGMVIIEISMARTKKLKSQILWYTIAATVIFLALTSYIIYLSSRRLTQPISVLSNAIQTISHGNLEIHVTDFSHMDELGVLSHGINHMTMQLKHERTVLQQRIDNATQSIRKSKKEAEDANLAKSRFLAAASHDLRQPIHALGLFLGVLSRTRLSAHQRKLLSNARIASEASSEMLNTLLDFSRIEAGVIEPQLQPFRLQPLLHKIENELAPLADDKGIVYRTRETHLAVHSDPALVELILRNLVSNAIRYTEHGGLLVACRRHRNMVMLEVWDTGIGIAPSLQKDVFREFHQLGNPERNRNKGLGLGLAIAEGLARTLGHELSLASTPHRGSVFRLILPLATELPVEEQHQMLKQHTAQMLNVRVLVVDDDETVRNGMGHLLRDWGCQYDTAESIEEAIAMAHTHPPDVVISDYRLHEQRSGMEAITSLRALFGDHLPALLITGDTAPERLREAQTCGIPLLHKPVSPSKLFSELAALLEARTSRPPGNPSGGAP